MSKDLSIYFQPWEPEKKNWESPLHEELGKIVEFHDQSGFPDWEKAKVAIFGVEEERRSNENAGCSLAPDKVREHLYSLGLGASLPIVDLGNIKAGSTVEDTYFAVSQVIAELVKRSVFPILIGGGHDLTYANYLAYEKLEQTVNLVTVDPRVDLGTMEEELSSRSFLGKIILHQPNYLFNYCNVALQTHYIDGKVMDLMDKLYFESFRLGEIRKDIQNAEPLIRNADIFSFDVSAIRMADAPGNKKASPNGLFGEEACQLCRYAGMNDKLSSAGFYEFNPSMDRGGQTAQLVAQMIWYLIDGIAWRKKDYPVRESDGFLKFRVTNENFDQEIIFFKSPKTDRWWMKVPYPPDKRLKFERHHMVPCTYGDYQEAVEGELPDLWWRTYQKLS